MLSKLHDALVCHCYFFGKSNAKTVAALPSLHSAPGNATLAAIRYVRSGKEATPLRIVGCANNLVQDFLSSRIITNLKTSS